MIPLIIGIVMVVAGYYLNEASAQKTFKQHKTQTATEGQSFLALTVSLLAWAMMGIGAIVGMIGIATLVCK